MALPIRHLLAQALMGDQEAIESVLLADIYSAGGSRNLYLDRYGRIGQILGYTRLNAPDIGTPLKPRGLAHYVNQTGGLVSRREFVFVDNQVDSVSLYSSVDAGAHWALVTQLFDTVATAHLNVGTIPDFAGSGNLLFLTNGVLAPRQYDGTTLTTAGSVQLAAPTFTSTGAGVLNGNISWRVLPVVGKTRKLSSVQSLNYAINLAAGAGHIDWSADPDVTVTGYEIYRTTGTGQLFYYSGSVVGRTTLIFSVGGATDLDTALIVGRVLQEFGDPPPPSAYFCEAHKQRIFYGRTDANPRTWWWSDPGVPYSVYQAFNNVDFTDAESFSDFGTGGTGEFQGMFIAWQERSVWTLSGDGTVNGTVTNWQRRRTNAQAGTVSHRTVAKVPAGAAYTDAEGNSKKTSQAMLAYLSPHKDIRLFDGDNDEIISYPKSDTLRRLTYVSRAKSWCLHDHARQEITWCYPADGANEPSIAVTWSYRWGVWFERDWAFAHAMEADVSDMDSVLLAGGSGAQAFECYQLWSGYTFNGTAIAAQWVTQTLYGIGFLGDAPGLYGKPMITFRKRWRKAYLLIEVAGGTVTLAVDWMIGDDPTSDAAAFASNDLTLPDGGALETSDGSAILTSDGSPIHVGPSKSIIKTRFVDDAGRYAYSRGIRLRIRSTTTAGQWFLSSIDTLYQLLPGLARE